MKIEAVTVCVNYSDFLQQTAKYNRGLFDSWLIVTEPKDHETREVCRKMNLRCIVSSDGSVNDTAFSKGRLVERALQHTSSDCWRLHIDSDIVLPADFRHRLKSAHLQKDVIYGCDRLMVKSYEKWLEVLGSDYLHGGQFDYHCRMQVSVPGVEVGSRWTHPSLGYVPIGFFQLWHSSQDDWRGIRSKPYPMEHGNACRSDVQHGLQWDREKRQLLPEVVVLHLESEPAELGANWNGRKTKKFGPSPKPPVHHQKHGHGHQHQHHHPKPVPSYCVPEPKHCPPEHNHHHHKKKE